MISIFCSDEDTSNFKCVLCLQIMNVGQYQEIEVEQREGAEQAPVVFLARTGAGEEQETTEQVEVGTGGVAYKVIPGLVTPGGLPIECFPAYEALIDRRPELVGAVNEMMRGAVAVGTARQYAAAIHHFMGFCKWGKQRFPNFTPDAVLEYVAECRHRGEALSRFRQVVPALQLLEKVAGREDTGLTAQV